RLCRPGPRHARPLGRRREPLPVVLQGESADHHHGARHAARRAAGGGVVGRAPRSARRSVRPWGWRHDDLRRVRRVLRSRDYFLFWSGSFIANLGVWIQQIALGYLVYDLTRRASLLGTVSFCGNAPILFLGLVGGAIADRASRRTIMLGTLGVIAATALTLAVLTASGHIAVWHIIAISMVAGTASALFAPAMQAVIPSLVEPGELLNAISLNSVQFNLARTIGPALAAGGCAIAFGLALCGMALVHTMPASMLLLFVMGVLQTVAVASLNTTIQTVVHDGMRGRVMSMMTVILFGFTTVGALGIGFV